MMTWLRPPRVVSVHASVNLGLDRVHELKPVSSYALMSIEPAYLLCLMPDDNAVCSHHVIVPARDLAPILFPEAK